MVDGVIGQNEGEYADDPFSTNPAAPRTTIYMRPR
jgi:hypothetical protein